MTDTRPFRIEFLGPPGVGKTTLFELTAARLDGDRPIIPRAELIRRAHDLVCGPAARVKWHAGRLISGKSADRKARKILAPHADRALLSCENIDRFLDAAFKALACGPRTPERRLLQAEWLIDDLRMAAVADRVYGRDLVMFDELLCQRGIGCLSAGGDRGLWDEYYRTVPAPRAVISVTAPADVIADRLQARGRRDRDYLADAATAREIAAVATAVLSERGIAMLEIDSREPADRNADIISAWLKDPDR